MLFFTFLAVMSTAASQALLPTFPLPCTGGMCGYNIRSGVLSYCLVELTFFCFIPAAQRSCCLIRSIPSPPTGTRMYYSIMSLENTPKASCGFSVWLSDADQDCVGERPVHPLPQALQR